MLAYWTVFRIEYCLNGFFFSWMERRCKKGGWISMPDYWIFFSDRLFLDGLLTGWVKV